MKRSIKFKLRGNTGRAFLQLQLNPKEGRELLQRLDAFGDDCSQACQQAREKLRAILKIPAPSKLLTAQEILEMHPAIDAVSCVRCAEHDKAVEVARK